MDMLKLYFDKLRILNRFQTITFRTIDKNVKFVY